MDRSVKLACPACTTTFLMAIGKGTDFDSVCEATLGWDLRRAAAVADFADLVDAFAAGAAAAASLAGEAAAVGGAFGPASTRFTFKVVSGSMMTRAYGLRATICAISIRSGSCWKFKP